MDFFFPNTWDSTKIGEKFEENLQFSHSWATKAPKQIENLPQTLCWRKLLSNLFQSSEQIMNLFW